MLSCKKRLQFSEIKYSQFQSKNVFAMDNTLQLELHTVHSWLVNTGSEGAPRTVCGAVTWDFCQPLAVVGHGISFEKLLCL